MPSVYLDASADPLLRIVVDPGPRDTFYSISLCQEYLWTRYFVIYAAE
jgi:hypothetical protein